MKNLPFLLCSLDEVSGDFTLDIYGVAEAGEWEKVEVLTWSMPENITVIYHGAIPPGEIDDAVTRAHFSVLPTRGENFGHPVFEALRLGRPVIVSDRVPWRGLEEAGAGWSIPLESGGVDKHAPAVRRHRLGRLSRAVHRGIRIRPGLARGGQAG